MPPVDLSFTTKRPAAPQADFAFYIDFKKGEGPAARVFTATHEFIRFCEQLDSELITSIDSSIETVMVLEDIEVGSLKVWFRNILTATDDQALKSLDWKPQVGKYLVKSKYAVLRWIDEGSAPRDIRSLGQEIRKLAEETDVRRLPAYSPVAPSALISAVRNFQSVKDQLVSGDRASMLVPDAADVPFNLSVRLNIEEIEALAVRETHSHSVPEMVLMVRKPDYLGTSMWELRHGRRSISVKIEDAGWLARFQARGVEVRPGDALKCEVRIDVSYGHDNELISEKYSITKVKEVLENQGIQSELPI